MTSSMRRRAAPMRWRQTAISSVALATRSARRSTSTSVPSSSRRMPSSSSSACAYPGASGGGVRGHGGSLSSGSARLRSEPVANWVVMRSPAPTSSGERTIRPSAALVMRPAVGQDVDRVERRAPGLPATRGGDPRRRAAAARVRAIRSPAVRTRRSPSASGRRAAALEAVDAHAEALVGALDGRVGAPGDALGPVDERAVGRRQSCAGGGDDRAVALLDRGEVGADCLDEGGGAGGRRLQRRVGDLVGDAAVDLVAEPGEHGHRCRGDRPGDRFGVERRQLVA